MKWFPNKIDENRRQHRLESSGQITVYIVTVQKKLANYLQLKTERLSVSKKKIALLLFSLLLGGCSIAVMLYSFLTVNTPIVNRPITFPKYALKPEKRLKRTDRLISRREYSRINQFKYYLEHLQEDSAGCKTYDSIMLARPHLLDSIHLADSLFLIQ